MRKQPAATLVADLDAMNIAPASTAAYAARAIVRWHAEKAGGRVAGVSDDGLCADFNSAEQAHLAAARAEIGLEAFFK